MPRLELENCALPARSAGKRPQISGLELTFREVREVRVVQKEGMEEVRLLDAALSDIKDRSNDHCVGKTDDRWLLARSRMDNDCSTAHSAGSEELKSLTEAFSKARRVSADH